MDSTSDPRRPADDRDPLDAQPQWSTGPPPPSAPAPGYQYNAPPPGVGAGPPPEVLAGFWIRFASAFIDGVILSIVANILALAFGMQNNGFAPDASAGGNWLQLLLGAAYFTYFHATAAGQTVGNRICGIRVLDAESGGSLPYPRALIRYLMSIVSAIPLLLGYFWMLWDPRKQTWHDKVGNSLVVRANAYPPGPFGRPASS